MKKKWIGLLTLLTLAMLLVLSGTVVASADVPEPVAWVDADSDGVLDEGETAYDDLGTALNAGGVIKLYRDLTVDLYYIAIGNGAEETVKVTLDLNGKTISGSCNALFEIRNAELTLTDSDPNGAGGISLSTTLSAHIADLYESSSRLTIESGSYSARQIIVINRDLDAKATVKGGSFEALSTAFGIYGGSFDFSGGTVRSVYEAIELDSNAVCRITGGRIETDQAVIDASGNAVCTVTGGVLGGYVVLDGNSRLAIDGGTFLSGTSFYESDDAVLEFSSGYFADDPREVIGDGLSVTFDPETELYYAEVVLVAWADADGDGEIDEDEELYFSLADALNAGGTVKLVDNYDASGEGSIDVGEYNNSVSFDVTLDLNGKTLTTATDGIFMEVWEGVSMTVVDSSEGKTGAITLPSSGQQIFYVRGELVLESGSFSAHFILQTSDDGEEGYLTVNGGSYFGIWLFDLNGGETVIGGGSFSGEDGVVSLYRGTSLRITGGSFADGEDQTVYIDEGLCTVTGGIFLDDVPFYYSGKAVRVLGGSFAVDPSAYLAPGATSVYNASTELYDVAPPRVAWVDSDSDGEIDEDETFYHTLTEALLSGECVKLFFDYDASEEGDILLGEDPELPISVTLDLNGKTLSSSADYFLDVYHATLTVLDSSTAKSGRIVSDGVYAIYLNESTSRVTFSGGALSGGLFVSDGVLTLEGGTLDFVFVSYGHVTLGDATVTEWDLVGGSYSFDPTPYLGRNFGSFTVSLLDGVYTLTPHALIFEDASLGLGEDLSLSYYIFVYDTDLLSRLDEISVRFTFKGKSVVVSDCEIEDRYLLFRFDGIAPQEMTAPIDATVYLGESAISCLDGYSVRESLLALAAYAEEEGDALLRQLAFDILIYGGAAQRYTGYRLDDLADAGLDPTVGTTSLPSEGDSVRSLKTAEGVTLGDVQIDAATVWFDSVNRLAIRLAAYTENTKVVITVDGESVTYANLTSAVILSDPIYAIDLGKVFTVELYEGDTLLQTLTYSVYSYVLEKMNETEADGTTLTPMANLARALYRYGAAAELWLLGPKGELLDDTVADPYVNGDKASTYDKENGWSGILDTDDCYSYFTLSLKAGTVVYYSLSDATWCGLWDPSANEDVYFYFNEATMPFGALAVEKDGVYTFYTGDEVTAKAWIVEPLYEVSDKHADPIEYSGESAEYDPELGWTPVVEGFTEAEIFYEAFEIWLECGDVLYVESSVTADIYIYLPGSFVGSYVEERGAAALVAPTSGYYTLYLELPYGSDASPTVRAWVVKAPRELTEAPALPDAPEDMVEITDTSDCLELALSTYDPALGWCGGMPDPYSPGTESFMILRLEAGEVLWVTSDVAAGFALLDPDDGTVLYLSDPYVDSWLFTIRQSGDYVVSVADTGACIRVYLGEAAVGGSFSGELTDKSKVVSMSLADYDPALGWSGGELYEGEMLLFALTLRGGDVLALSTNLPTVFILHDNEDGEIVVTSGETPVTEWTVTVPMGLDGEYMIAVSAVDGLYTKAYLNLDTSLVELTDQSDRVLFSEENYSSEAGWSGVETEGGSYNYLAFELREGEVAAIDFSTELSYVITPFSIGGEGLVPGEPILGTGRSVYLDDPGMYLVSTETGATLRLYILSEDLRKATMVTDENVLGGTTYDKELGWDSVYSEEISAYSCFGIELHAGDRLYYLLSSPDVMVALFGPVLGDPILGKFSGSLGVIEATESSVYAFCTSGDVFVQAWLVPSGNNDPIPEPDGK